MSEDHMNTDLIDDKLLVEKCVEDNRRYQEILYRKYAEEMFRVCKRYAKDKNEAMDFLQDGFIEVFRKIHSFRFEGSLEGWIRRVIVYKTIDALRKEKRYQEVVSQLDEKAITEAKEFELKHKSNVSVDKIKAMVNELPGKAGLVLKLYVLEGLTHKEIAEYLEITVGTSKSQLSRARTLLKAALKKNE